MTTRNDQFVAGVEIRVTSRGQGKGKRQGRVLAVEDAHGSKWFLPDTAENTNAVKDLLLAAHDLVRSRMKNLGGATAASTAESGEEGAGDDAFWAVIAHGAGVALS